MAQAFRIGGDGTADRAGQRAQINERVACELCGDGRTSPWRRVRAHYSDDWFGVSRCSGCGLLFVTPRLSEAFRAFCYARETHLVDWFLRERPAARVVAERALDLIEGAGCPGRDLLEIGCGIGTLLDAARERGFGTMGVEPNEGTARFAGRAHRVLHGALEEVDVPAASFDVVVMEQTLEHLPRPLAALERAGALLRPGGVLYVGVPQVDWLRLALDRIPLGRRLAGSLWSPEDHLYYFTPEALRRLLLRAGLAPLALPNRPRFLARKLLGLSAGQFLARKPG